MKIEKIKTWAIMIWNMVLFILLIIHSATQAILLIPGTLVMGMIRGVLLMVKSLFQKMKWNPGVKIISSVDEMVFTGYLLVFPILIRGD